jgi:hypothetical protein
MASRIFFNAAGSGRQIPVPTIELLGSRCK